VAPPLHGCPPSTLLPPPPPPPLQPPFAAAALSVQPGPSAHSAWKLAHSQELTDEARGEIEEAVRLRWVVSSDTSCSDRFLRVLSFATIQFNALATTSLCRSLTPRALPFYPLSCDLFPTLSDLLPTYQRQPAGTKMADEDQATQGSISQGNL
jgi:hypothetical protein